ncbi:DUF998 domain-containing protein [Marilutibacter chinensis]|uniref:DUF998 domain-containing protein n=1 Tax=Marilutibacter chinensis TaxID=2912247 RepID=A0ABS9HQC4_9GAMM|nr:DUF998 domain-containing protein [Lysobacter chinensis]MCF7220706.1 DUF998 domain-containing protein [Lysobacter chinensis]
MTIPSVLPRRLGTLALGGVLAFALVCTVAQFVRTDLDWLRTPLSFYLLDPYGLWVQTAYFALALSLVSLGVGWYVELRPQARSAAPMLLFACAGLALAVTALAETGRHGQPVTLETLVHGLAAQAAFLCVTTAMLLQAWRLRRDPRWRRCFAAAFVLAALAFVGLWVHALWRDAPRGLTQKVEIAMILIWLGVAANGLRKGGDAVEAGVPELQRG